MKRFFSGLFAALVVVLSAAPFLYVFVRSFLSPGGVTFQYYYDVFLASPKYLFRFWKSIGMAVCIAAGQLLISVQRNKIPVHIRKNNVGQQGRNRCSLGQPLFWPNLWLFRVFIWGFECYVNSM